MYVCTNAMIDTSTCTCTDQLLYFWYKIQCTTGNLKYLSSKSFFHTFKFHSVHCILYQKYNNWSVHVHVLVLIMALVHTYMWFLLIEHLYPKWLWSCSDGFTSICSTIYSQICIKRSPLGQRKSGLIRQVTS
jgi:hypothetical protein